MTLEGMTQQRWDAMTPVQRDEIRDLSGLTPQLVGLEGWRVEVIDRFHSHDFTELMEAPSETRRFIVGRSTGWVPCHLEIKRRDSSGGFPASKEYETVRKLYRAQERSYA